jgi:hypothetical protein
MNHGSLLYFGRDGWSAHIVILAELVTLVIS